jgi:hypothetical protein
MCICCNGWSSNVTHRKNGGINVESETERLWKDEILSNLHNNALVDEPVLKSYFVTAMVQEPIQPLLEEVNKRSMRMP